MLAGLLVAERAEAACPSPATDQTIRLPGRPFAAEPSADGCHLYVSLDRSGRGAVTVLDNVGGTFRIARTVDIAPRPARGLALSHSGALLAVAAEGSVVLLDIVKLGTPDQVAQLATLPTANHGAIYTLFSKDDALLFVSEERNGSIAVVNAAALMQGGGERAVIGRIPVGEAPVGLALSADGGHLYSTSEIVGASSECRPEQDRGRNHAKGALFSIDIAKAATDPRHAVSGVMKAGCNPVRVVVSADGHSLWVSERGDGRIMGLDPTVAFAGAKRASTTVIAVGQAPVGLAIRPDGTQLWIGDSDRFGGAAGSLVLVSPAVPADAHVVSTSKVGDFPRDLRFLPDGKTLVVALFGDSAVLIHPTPEVTHP